MPKRNDTATGMDEAVPFPAVLAASTMAAVDRSPPVVDLILDSQVDPLSVDLLSVEGIRVARSRRTVRTTAAVSVEAAFEVSATKFDLQHMGSARNFSGARGPLLKTGINNAGRLSPPRVPVLSSRDVKISCYLVHRT